MALLSPFRMTPLAVSYVMRHRYVNSVIPAPNLCILVQTLPISTTRASTDTLTGTSAHAFSRASADALPGASARPLPHAASHHASRRGIHEQALHGPAEYFAAGASVQGKLDSQNLACAPGRRGSSFLLLGEKGWRKLANPAIIMERSVTYA